MKVEVLYVAECPSHPAAVKLVRDVLNSEGVEAEVRTAEASDRGTRAPGCEAGRAGEGCSDRSR